MLKPLLILISLFFTNLCRAQAPWQKTVGLNLVLPPAARTFEITSEFSPHPAYSLTFNAGYTHRTTYKGYIKIYDGIENRRSSGAFVKIGGRVYLLSLVRQQPTLNLFAGAQLIGSHYHQTGLIEIIDPGFSPVPPDPKVKASGIMWGAALTGGITFRMAQRIALDGGLQYGFQARRDDYLGSRSFNYQPGFGISRSGPHVTSLQGILTIKYRF